MIHTRENGEDDIIIPDVTRGGAIFKKTVAAKKTPPPRDSEELRAKYALINNAWLFARALYANRDWLATATTTTNVSLAEYVLGKEVRNSESAKPRPGKVVVSPACEIVLANEY